MAINKESHFENHMVLLFSIIAGGLLSVLLGKDLCWDVASYHYYNPYALLHHRHSIDYWPATFVHVHFTPTLDLFSYFFINYFPPKMTEFLMGGIHGLNLWLLFLIARCFFKNHYAFFLAIAIALVGLYGPTALPGVGSFQNDNFVSLFVLGFVFLQVKCWKGSFSNKVLLISSFILGISAGLKLTASIFILGAFCAQIIMPIPWRERVKCLFVGGIGVFFGVMLVSGYWMLFLWKQHHNPFFPLLNNIFHSPDFPAVSWKDARFLPKGIGETVFYPFYFSLDGRTGDNFFQDFRFAVVYLLFIIMGIGYLWKKLHKKPVESTSLAEYWLLVFYVCSYAVWQCYFSIMRYGVVLEMLAPLIIALQIKKIIKPNKLRALILGVILSGLAFLMLPADIVRASWYDSDFFNVKLPMSINKIPSAMTLVAFPAYALDTNPRPQTYLLPFFPPEWKFVGVPFFHGKLYLPDDSVRKKIKILVDNDKGPFYLLTSDNSMIALSKAAKSLGLVSKGKCELIFSDRQSISHTMTQLCPMIKEGRMS